MWCLPRIRPTSATVWFSKRFDSGAWPRMTTMPSSGPVPANGSRCLSASRRPGSRDLGQALGRRADEQLPPRLGVVEEVEVLEGEGEPEVGRDGLRVDPQPPQPAVLEPGDRLAVRVGGPVDGAEDVVDHRAAAERGHLLEAQAIGLAVARRDRHLDEALAATGEHAGEHPAGLVVHDVGRHGRAVVVALHRHGARGEQTLRRPPAGAGVHRLVEQPAELGVLGVGRHHAGLGPVEAEHPHEQRRRAARRAGC